MLHTQYEKALFPFYDKLWELRFGKTSKVTIICSSNLSAVQGILLKSFHFSVGLIIRNEMHPVALYHITTYYKYLKEVYCNKFRV